MKKYLLILFLSFFTALTGLAQEDESDQPGASKLQEKMKIYIQKKLGLSRAEAQRFSPVFVRYIVELRRTHRENKTDKPVRDLKVAELRIRFRNEFRQIMDEQRANKVYEYEREFQQKVIKEFQERKLENRPRRIRALLPAM
jgi:hypothetical protein